MYLPRRCWSQGWTQTSPLPPPLVQAGRWGCRCRAPLHASRTMFAALCCSFPEVPPLSAGAVFECPQQPKERGMPDFCGRSPPYWPVDPPSLPRRRAPVLGPSCGVALSSAVPHMAASSAVHKIQTTPGRPAIGPLNRLLSPRALQNSPRISKQITRFPKK